MEFSSIASGVLEQMKPGTLLEAKMTKPKLSYLFKILLIDFFTKRKIE